jgi:hypothetical protein
MFRAIASCEFSSFSAKSRSDLSKLAVGVRVFMRGKERSVMESDYDYAL